MDSSLAQPLYVWVSMDSSSAIQISASGIASPSTKTVIEGDTTFIRVRAENLPAICKFIHGSKTEVGGFGVHKSLSEAKQYIARLHMGDLFLGESIFTVPVIANADVAKAMEFQIDPKRMNDFTKKLLGAFSSRHYQILSAIQATQWIKCQWEEIVYSRSDIEVSTYDHSTMDKEFKQKSIIVTLTGSEQGNDIVILGAHLYSINDNSHSQELAPGEDDNASGIAVLTEVLTGIVATNFKPKKTLQIVCYGMEERGRLGSSNIAKDYKNNGKKVLGMLNFDLVGWSGNGKIFLSEDFSNADHAELLTSLLDHYLPDLRYGFMKCNYPCSDNASWYVNDFPGSMKEEGFSPEDMNPNYHSENDKKDVNESYMSGFARLGVVYISELTKGTVMC